MPEVGEAASMCDIARREGTNHSYIARHINLTLLAPKIVTVILDKTLQGGGAPIEADYQLEADYQPTNAVGRTAVRSS